MSVLQATPVPNPESSEASRPPVEIGLVMAGQFDPIDREAVEVARRQVTDELESRFPNFAWRLSSVSRPELDVTHRVDPVALLNDGRTERDFHQWDFVLLITAADLIGHRQPFVLAIVSRTLDLAVISTARIDPHAYHATAGNESRIDRIADRLRSLMLRCLGHLNGLIRSDERSNLMWDADHVDELDGVTELTSDQVDVMTSNLEAIADLRLEEQTGNIARSQFTFYIRAAWTERQEILAGVLEAEPWQFPLRLSRLTTAAVSSMLILLMTAETWDMAMSQSAWTVAELLLVAIGVTTAYVVMRQRLLVRRKDRLLSEQIAVSNVTTTLIVLCGLATTLVLLIAAALLMSHMLFSRSIVREWVASVQTEIAFSHYLRLCSVVAGFSLCIGALGAAFEDQAYFRHVTFVDEEL